jgi:uncharacterized protein (DUF362 family)/Pyruvate/2-oxoacid:ferredoxin oxidoreductase delta subunit
VALVSCPSYEEGTVQSSLAGALESLGGIRRWISPGNTVFVKPNMLTAKKPERAITTHPALVEAIVREVQGAGGIALVGDSPAGVMSSINRYWNETGYSGVARRTGAKLVKLEGAPVAARTVNGRTYHISAAVAQADVVINVPKLKTHGLTVLTGGVKNPFGVIPGFRKAELHKLAPKPLPFSEIIADVYEAVRPELTIMDAVVALEGDGPSTKGAPVKMGALLAGTDAVALDAVASALLGLREGDVPTTAAALRRGLGVGIDSTDVVGESVESMKADGFRHASSRLIHIVPTWAVWLLGRYLWVRPHVVADKCVSCGLCIETCPVEAISPGPDMISRIDHSKCIECLACVESCPEDSIEQKVSWFARRFA